MVIEEVIQHKNDLLADSDGHHLGIDIQYQDNLVLQLQGTADLGNSFMASTQREGVNTEGSSSLQPRTSNLAPYCAAQTKVFQSTIGPPPPPSCSFVSECVAGIKSHGIKPCAPCLNAFSASSAAKNLLTRSKSGFLCIWQDPRFCEMRDVSWKRYTPNETETDWEKDERKHGSCKTAEVPARLCQLCFCRMNQITGFGRFFDAEHGRLHRNFRGDR